MTIMMTGCTPAPDPAPEPSGTLLQFQKELALPDTPPRLNVKGKAVAPMVVEWREGAGEWFLQDDPSTIPRLVTDDGIVTLELSNTVTPSQLDVKIYRGAFDDIDPAAASDIAYDCIFGDECRVMVDGSNAFVDLTAIWPNDARAVVFSVQAWYFGSNDKEAYANTVAWAFEMTRRRD